MVSAIDSNIINTASQAATAVNSPKKANSIKSLIKYANNETLVQAPDTFTNTAKSGASSSVFFEGIPFAFLLKRNKKLYGTLINEKMKALGQKNQQALQNLLHGKGNIFKRIGDFISTANKSVMEYSNIKSSVKTKFKEQKAAAKAAKRAAKTAGEKTVTNAAKEAAETAVKTTGNTAKTKTVSNAAAQSSAGKAVKSAGNKISNKFLKRITSSKFGKFMKSSGAGIMLAFSGIAECLTEVVPTFKELGAEKGLKQLGKSAVKVAGDTAGFIAGQQAGVAVGTAVGTAIFPGVGTAIGAAVGFVGGLLGSFVAGKITKAITGPSEREIAKEEQYNQAAEEIASDNTQLQELERAVSIKIQQESQNGELSEDALAALESLENLNNTDNPFAA